MFSVSPVTLMAFMCTRLVLLLGTGLIHAPASHTVRCGSECKLVAFRQK